MLRLYRRSLRLRYLRSLFILVGGIIILDLLFISWIFMCQQWSLSRSASSVEPITDRVFIASTHWNNEVILRSHWNAAVLDLVQHIGIKNVYVSVYESGSWDNSKGALRDLDRKLNRLGVQRTIVLDKTTHADEIVKVPTPGEAGWIDTPRGRKELRRIPFLAGLRNLSLKPLEELASQGVKFDKILFLNDVVFTTDDVRRLFATRNGDYAAACSMDFAHAPKYYDTFALRDSDGDATVMQTFPYFRSSASRRAMIAGHPVPLQSCWNGMVVLDALPFYSNNSNKREDGNDSNVANDVLRFRGIPDSLAKYHLEASECCLIHVDNPLTPLRGVWMNPSVRVAYNPAAYDIVAGAGRWWPSSTDRFRGIWWNRLVRWTTSTWPQRWRIKRRVGKWEAERTENYEPGMNCLINEMQVLIANGWAHL